MMSNTSQPLCSDAGPPAPHSHPKFNALPDLCLDAIARHLCISMGAPAPTPTLATPAAAPCSPRTPGKRILPSSLANSPSPKTPIRPATAAAAPAAPAPAAPAAPAPAAAAAAAAAAVAATAAGMGSGSTPGGGGGRSAAAVEKEKVAVAKYAAGLALVGSPAFIRISIHVYDAFVDPGCKAAREQAFKRHQLLCAELSKESHREGVTQDRRDELVYLLGQPPLSALRCAVRTSTQRLVSVLRAARRNPSATITATQAHHQYHLRLEDLQHYLSSQCHPDHRPKDLMKRLYDHVAVVRLANTLQPDVDRSYWACANVEAAAQERARAEGKATKKQASMQKVTQENYHMHTQERYVASQSQAAFQKLQSRK